MTCWRCSGESGFTIDPTAITFIFDLLVSAMLGDDDDNVGPHLVFTRGENDIFHVIYATAPTPKTWPFRYDGGTFSRCARASLAVVHEQGCNGMSASPVLSQLPILRPFTPCGFRSSRLRDCSTPGSPYCSTRSRSRTSSRPCKWAARSSSMCPSSACESGCDPGRDCRSRSRRSQQP